MSSQEAVRTWIQRYRQIVTKFVDPLSPVGILLCFVVTDIANRYTEVSKELRHGSVLDVGAGGRSILALKAFNTVSVDIRSAQGTDLVASASHLPFRENAFTNVVSVDTIEHIPNQLRKPALLEMVRVAGEKVIIHCPLEDGEDFLSRRYDVVFHQWYKKIYGHSEPYTTEHIANVEPHPDLFLPLRFTIKGTHNAELWLNCARLFYLPSKLLLVNMIIAWVYFLTHKSKNGKAPYWGGICVYKKNVSNSEVHNNLNNLKVIEQTTVQTVTLARGCPAERTCP